MATARGSAEQCAAPTTCRLESPPATARQVAVADLRQRQHHEQDHRKSKATESYDRVLRHLPPALPRWPCAINLWFDELVGELLGQRMRGIELSHVLQDHQRAVPAAVLLKALRRLVKP